ncbi:hypothetical protein RJ640_018999 [Escallonia rubra]|uniref:ABC-type xenobiotic transporter n=1 Tax=Escallonia rubra TaxID=112253 RepID=A0AA88QP95_9ASTE|nr:hypothetical protein RJ640_018999 [Escallonia rubra]
MLYLYLLHLFFESKEYGMAESLWTIFCGDSDCSYNGGEECSSGFLAIFDQASCANHILVIIVNILQLFILVFVILQKRSPSKTKAFSQSRLSICSAISNGGLGLVYLGWGIWIIQERLSSGISLTPLHDWLVMLTLGFTWCLLSLTVSLGKCHLPMMGVKLPSTLAFFLAAFLCIPSLWIFIVKKDASLRHVLDILTFPGAIILLFCAFRVQKYAEPEPDMGNGALCALLQREEVDACNETNIEDKVTPFAKAGFLSRMSFWWLNPLLKKGKQKVIEDEDIPKLRQADQADICYFRFGEELTKQKEKGSSDSPSILSTLLVWQWKAILVSGFFALIKVLTLATGPLILKAFIRLASGEEAFKYEGYALTGGLFLAKLLESLSERQWYFRTRLIGLQIRSLFYAAIYQKQLRLSSAAKATHSAGQIMNYVTVDSYRFGEFPYWFHQIWTTLLQICLALVIIYYSMGLATFAALFVIIVTVLGNSPLVKLQHKYLTKLMVAQDRRLKAITEALTSMKVLKLYAWETHFKSVIEGLRKEEIKWLSAVLSQKGFYLVLFWSSPMIVSAATFWACYFVGIPLNASNVFTFLATLRIVQEPIRSIPDIAQVCIEAKVSLNRIVKFLEAPELHKRHLKERYNLNKLEQSIMISTTGISWDVNSTKSTLADINLVVKPGEKVAICGEVGSGKSTLLAAILGEVSNVNGTVEVYGKLAYVSQTAWIHKGTIQDNVLFGSNMDQIRYQEVLNKCSLVKDLEMLPFGDCTVIGERGVNLSGGQKQRVQLARALYQDADIYLLDDPFSAVDAHTATSLFNEYVMGALSGKTVLLVTHQVDFLPAFDNILLMSEGRILKAADYDQLLASSQEFQNLVNAHKETAGSGRQAASVSHHSSNPPKEEIQKIYTEENLGANLGDQLIKQEERETGDTGLKPYIEYLSHSKGFLFLSLSVIFHLTYIVGQLIQSYWLAAEVQDSSTSRFKLILIYMVIGCVASLFLILRSCLIFMLGLRVSESTFSKLMTSLFRAPMSFYDSTPLGRILSRVSSDLSILDLELAFKLSPTIGSTMNAYFCFGVLAILIWPMFFVIILMVYITIILQKFYYASAKELMRTDGTTKSSVASHLAESIAGAMTIRAFGEEDQFFSEHFQLIDANASASFHNFSANEWLIQRLEVLCAIIVSSSALALTLVQPDASESGFIGMALSYGLSLNVYLVFSVQSQCLLSNMIISVERLEQYMHVPSEASEKIEGNRPPLNWPSVGRVEISDLKVRYRPNAPLVLQGISCIFEGGHKIGIVGRTGSGKTTLISALFRLIEPAEGMITVDDINISNIGLHDLRSHFGIIPQDPTLFSGSVRYNLDPLSEHSDHEIWEVLEKCQLRPAVQGKEEGLNSLVAQDGSNWSMGQRQLFCLGRALLKRRKILVLDEATASIDNTTDSIIQKTLRTEFADCTVITVAHRIPTVMDCTMVLAISDGKLVEYDEPMKLLDQEGSLFGQLVKEYWSHAGNASGYCEITYSSRCNCRSCDSLNGGYTCVLYMSKSYEFNLPSFLLIFKKLAEMGPGIKNALYAPLQDEEVETSYENSVDDAVTPFEKAGILSRMTFWWLNPLLKKGKANVIEDKDIPKLRQEDQAGMCLSLFMEQLTKQKQRSSSDGPSILSTIFIWQRKAILISGCFALIKVLALATGPLLLKAFIRVAEGEKAFEYEGYALAGGLFLAKCLESLSERQWYFRTRLIGLQVRSLLSAAVYKKQLRLSNAAKTTHSPGQIMNYSTVDIYRIGEYPYWFHQIWTTSLQICLALAIIYYSVGLATFAALFVIILTVLGNSPLIKLQHKYITKLMVAQDGRLKAITETLTSMKVLKLYAWETHFKNVIEGLREEELNGLSSVLSQRGYYLALYWASPIIVSAATFWACYFMGIPLNASSIFTFLATLRIVQEPIRLIPDVAAKFIEGKVSLSRIVKFLEESELQQIHIKERYPGKGIDQSIVISSTRMSWNANSSKPTLANIDLVVKPGEKVAICGEVGSGKSTLLAAILGEVSNINGTVQVYGTIAYVSQTAWIQTGTIQENILFGSLMDEQRYQKVLDKCSLVKDLEMLPSGDGTVIGERGVNLSGGQKQRLQLARALYQDADIYLLDDPFSAVDAHTATNLFNDYVMEALSGRTVLLVTHQVDFLPAFDCVLLMSEGKILKAATYDQLLATSQEFQSLVRAHKDTAGSEGHAAYVSQHGAETSKEEIQKISAEEQWGTHSVDQLIKKEERETGDRGLMPYRQYLSQSKGFLYLSLAVAVHAAHIIGQFAQNFWLAAEVQDSSISRSKMIIIYMLIGCAMGVFLLLRSYFVVILGLGTSKSMFSTLMTSLIRAPMSFYDSTPVGRILSRVSSDLSIVDLELAFALSLTIGTTINTYFSFGILALLTWPILCVIIPMVFITISLQKFYFASAKELMRIDGTTKSSCASHLAESIAGAVTIRAFRQEERFFSDNLHLIDVNASSYFHKFAANEWLIQRLEMLCAIVVSASALAMTLVSLKASESGFVGMALSYGLSLNVFLVFSVQSQCSLSNMIISVERIEQYMHIPSEAPEIILGNRPSFSWPSVGRVEIRDLKVRYRPNAPLVLRGISCIFEGGHKVGIVGRTGSGKTTLISALFRLVEPTEGMIIIDDLNISSIGLHDLRSHLGIIPQDPTLFSGSVRYNLDPLSEHTDHEIWEVLEKCQLRQAIQEKEEGLNSLVVQDGSNWSMGQRQLFCLGRALLKRRKILVLDEATASIDNATDSIIQRTIRTECADCTVITVAHRIPTVMDCTMVLAIADGELVEYDDPMKLMNHEGSLFAQLVKEYWSHSENASAQSRN